MDSSRRIDVRAVGPYRLERRLGGGGLGEVFLGRSPDGRAVAVRLVGPEFAADPGFRRRFAARVNAARRVDGPRTARLVDADPDADPPWLATAHVPGPSLREAVDLDGPLPAPALATLGSGLAEALAAIHGCGLLHHDLEPSNVILAEDGPRVIDFGIAGIADDPSCVTPRPAIGAPSFTSPEQARAHDVGPPADVFALGAVLAFAATGRPPFGTGPAEAVLHRVVHGEPDLAGVPEPLAALVADCLAKDPLDRPAVGDVLARLPVPSGDVAERAGEAVYVRDKRWQATTGFKSGVIISWFVMLPLSWIVLMQDFETSAQIAVGAAVSLLFGALFTLLALVLPADRLVLSPGGLTVRGVEEKTVRWDGVEQVAVIGDGKGAKIVVWYAGDDRPIDGPDLAGGTVVCGTDDVIAPQDLPRLRDALARFAGTLYRH